MISDVLYAVEIWLLVAALSGWFLCRAALALRQPPRTFAELLPAGPPDAHGPARAAPAGEVESLRRGLRIYDSS